MLVLLSYSGSRPALTPLAIWAVWPQTMTRSCAVILMFEDDTVVVMQEVEDIGIFQPGCPLSSDLMVGSRSDHQADLTVYMEYFNFMSY